MKRIESSFKKYMILIASGMGIIILSAIYISHVESSDLPSKEEMQVVKNEAGLFSKDHDQSDCISETEKKVKPCGDHDLNCRITSRLFLRECLNSAKPVKVLCESAISGSTLAKTSSFSATFCTNHREIDLVVCVNTFEEIEHYCQSKE